jgi:hypothetical protein
MMGANEPGLEVNGKYVKLVPGYFLGSVDQAYFTKSGVHFTCWSVLNPEQQHSASKPARFIVTSESGIVLTTPPNHDRHDIARKFGDETLRCGLKLDLGLELIPPPLIAKFEFYAYDGEATATKLDFFEKNNQLGETEIRSAADFVRLIQGPSTRVKNKQTLLYASVHGLQRFRDDFPICAGAVCVIGYRILDHEVTDTDVIGIFNTEIDRLLSAKPNIPKGLFLRWHTSLQLIAGYLAYQQGDRTRAQQHFAGILALLPDQPSWPTATSNILIGIYASGYLLMEERKPADAISLWRKADGVLRLGLGLANFENYYAYGELTNALNIARECDMAIRVVEAGGPLHDARLAPDGLGLDPRTMPGPLGRISEEYRTLTGETDPLAAFKGLRPK